MDGKFRFGSKVIEIQRYEFTSLNIIFVLYSTRPYTFSPQPNVLLNNQENAKLIH